MSYTLDTNVLLHYVRKGSIREEIETKYRPFGSPQNPIISIVSVAEIQVLAAKHEWSNAKLAELQDLLSRCVIVEVNSGALVSKYIELELYSLDLHPVYALPTSHRKVGKNDLWIAATAAVSESTLLTSDGDFGHFDPHFLELASY